MGGRGTGAAQEAGAVAFGRGTRSQSALLALSEMAATLQWEELGNSVGNDRLGARG